MVNTHDLVKAKFFEVRVEEAGVVAKDLRGDSDESNYMWPFFHVFVGSDVYVSFGINLEGGILVLKM